MKRIHGLLPGALALLLLGGCAAPRDLPPLPLADAVDLARFMGDWYVIGHIPTPIDRDHVNAVEHYARRADGRIATTYRYQSGSDTAPVETLHPVGVVRTDLDPGNAIWDMRFPLLFSWTIGADYRIAWLDHDYHSVIIGRQARDYVWLMARAPHLPAARVDALKQRIAAMGYDLTHWRDLPQRPRPTDTAPPPTPAAAPPGGEPTTSAS